MRSRHINPNSRSKCRKSGILNLLVVSILIVSGVLVFGASPMNQPSPEESISEAMNITPESTTRTVYGVQDTFSTPDLPNYFDQWGYNSVVQVTDGELELNTHETSYSLLIRRYVNVSQGDFTFSFNFRVDSDKQVSGVPWILNFSSVNWNLSLPLNYVGKWGIELRMADNYTIMASGDDGSLRYTDETPVYVTYYSVNKLLNDTNYQFSLTFDRSSDTVDLLVINKATSATTWAKTLYTAHTCKGSSMQLPDRFTIGDSAAANNKPLHWYYDNITLSYTTGEHATTALQSAAIATAISTHGTQLLTADDTPGQINLGRHLADDTPYGVLKDSIYLGSRDDVAGDMMSSLCSLYEYTGNLEYLELAEDIWTVLETHQQPDGGFTFADINNDFSDTVARIQLGLLALYRVTGNVSYLEVVNETAENLIGYQRTTGFSVGMFYGHVTRPAAFSVGIIHYFQAYATIALFESYKYTGNIDHYTSAVLGIDYLAKIITVSSRPITMHFPSYPVYSDYNDVVAAGASLWAFSESYKVTGRESDLTNANKVATYLLGAEFTKDDLSFGAWAGIYKDRLNQSDLVYNYLIPFGLKSYNDVVPGNEDVEGALNASLNFYASILGSTSSVQDHALNGATGVWGGCWNFNDTSDQGWTVGWWAEGDWGTWGEVGFFGWAGNVIKVMTMTLAKDATDSVNPCLRSIFKVNSTGSYKGVFASSPDMALISLSVSSGEAGIIVSLWDVSKPIVAEFVATGGSAVFTASGLDPSYGYRVYQDGALKLEQPAGSPVVTFTAGAGEFEIVVWDLTADTTLPDPIPTEGSPKTSDPAVTSFTYTSIGLIAVVGATAVIMLLLLARRTKGPSRSQRS